jgi:ribonuclease D
MTDVIRTPEALDDLVEVLTREPTIGLDTEFLRERTYHPQLALVQVRWATGSALIDPLTVDVAALAPLLEPPHLFVIHAAAQDLEILEHRVGRAPSRLFDPQIAAGFLGYRSPSLDTLVRELLGLELSKSDQLTDWTRRPLSESQLKYALADVEHLLELHRILEERLEARGRLAWVHEECERFLRRDRRRGDRETLWWKLKGQKKLPRRAAAVAQSLTAFREREAARLDLPVRYVLSDMAILAMAHRPPTSEAQLRSARGLEGGRLTSDRVEAILAAVEEGISMPPERQRLPPSTGPRERVAPGVVSLCTAWASQRADDEDLDPAILGTRDEVEAFASGDRTTRLASGFRHAIVGRDLERILAGEAAVAAGPGGKLRLVDV